MNINEIATLANNLSTKTKKREAFDVVLQAIDQGGQIDSNELAKLYQYFTPPIPKKPTTPEQWVALAMAKNDIRYYLNHIYSDGGRLMATDGHRLHVYKTNKYPVGFYDQNMNLIEVDATYPQIDRVIPENATRYEFEESPETAELSSKYPKIKHGFNWFMKSYIDAARVWVSTTQFKTCGKDKAVLVENDDCFAVIMPIRY
jgi:hypothetical protein